MNGGRTDGWMDGWMNLTKEYVNEWKCRRV